MIMKKIHGIPKKNSFLFCVVSVLAITTILITGCDLFASKQTFSDAYYDNNFIAAIGFDQFEGANTAIPAAEALPVTGRWDFAYRYQTWDGFPYMTLTPASVASGDPGTTASAFGTVPAGLAADAPVYRLTLANLIEGGDFEGATPEAGWTKDNITSPVSFLDVPSGTSIDHWLQMSLSNPSHFVEYAIPATIHTFQASKGYQLAFRWDATDAINAINADKITTNGSSTTFNSNDYTASSLFTADAVNTLRFATDKTLSLSIDDITVKRDTSISSAQLRLLLTVKETEPSLESLMYRFTFWVCEDPQISAIASPYALDTLKAEMLPVSGYSTVTTEPSPDNYVYTNDTASYGWKKMTVSVTNGNLQFTTKTLPVLELVINLDLATPGQILIAQPELRCYPDGY